MMDLPASSDETSEDRHDALFAEVGPRKRLGLWTLVPALVIFLFCVSLPTIMLWYLLSRPAISPATEDMYLFEGAIIASEGSHQSSTVSSTGGAAQTSTLYGLAFATIINHIYSITVPLLMGLLAYRVAAVWLHPHSEPEGEKNSEPASLTPLQYGVMLKIYGSSNLFTLLQSARYLYRQRWAGILKSPVVSSFVALAFVLLLSHAISLADLWLHLVSGTVIYSSVSPVDDLASLSYGTTINTTICPYPGYMQLSYSYIDPEESLTPGAIPPGQNCASYNNAIVQSLPPGPGWGDIMDPSVLAASVSASNNMSDFRMSIVIESNSMAVLVPPLISSNGLYNFTTSTYGLSMSCQSPNCQLYQSGPLESPDGGPFGCTDFSPAYNASLYNLTSFLYDPTTMAQQPNWSNGTGVNPFGFFIELPFDNIPGHYTSGSNASNSTNGEPGWYYGVWPGSVVYLTQCTVTSYDVVLTNVNNTYAIANASLTDFNTTSALSTGFLAWMSLTYLLPQIQNVMNAEIASANFSSILQSQMMLRALALNAGILAAMPVNASTLSTTRIASRYPIAPVATFVALLYAYGVLALVVVGWTCFLRSDSIVMHSNARARTESVLQMVQLRLTDPLAVVAESFTHHGSDSVSELEETVPQDWRRTLATDALDMFEPGDRRGIAPQVSRTTSGDLRFGLRKRYAMLSVNDAEAESEATAVT